MRIARTCTLLLAIACIALGARAQNSGLHSPDGPSRAAAANTTPDTAKPADAATAKAAAPVAATREEVEQLRSEVAELKAVIQRLLDEKGQPKLGAATASAKSDAPTAGASVSAVATESTAQPATTLESTEGAAADPAGISQ